MARPMTVLHASAGLFAGPLAWAVHQQLGYMLVPVSCRSGVMLVPLVTLGAAVLLGLGAWVSWRARTPPGETEAPRARTQRFTAHLALLVSAVFAFAILLQASSTMLLNGCQR